MSNNKVTDTSLIEAITNRGREDIERARKSLEEVWKKTGIENAIAKEAEKLNKQYVKPVYDGVRTVRDSEVIKKPDSWFQKQIKKITDAVGRDFDKKIVQPIVKRFDKDIVQPVNKKVVEPALKGIDRYISKPIQQRAVDPLRRFMEGQFRNLSKLDQAINRNTERIFAPLRRSIDDVARTASRYATELPTISGAAKAIPQIARATLKMAPAIDIVLQILQAQKQDYEIKEILTAVKANGQVADRQFSAILTRLGQLERALNGQGGQELKTLTNVVNQIKNDTAKIPAIQASMPQPSAINAILAGVNAISPRLASLATLPVIAGQVASLAGVPGAIAALSGKIQPVNLAPLQTGITNLTNQVTGLNSRLSGNLKVDFSPIQPQLNNIQRLGEQTVSNLNSIDANTRNIKPDLSPLQQQLNNISSAVSGIPGRVASTINLSGLQGQISALPGQVSSQVNSTVAGLGAGIASLNGQMGKLTTDVAALPSRIGQPDFRPVTAGLSALEGQIGSVLNNLNNVNNNVVATNANLVTTYNQLNTGIGTIMNGLSSVNGQIVGLNGQINDVNELIKAQDKVLQRTFNILGGEAIWQFTGNTPKMQLNVEEKVKESAKQQLEGKQSASPVDVTSVVGISTAIAGFMFARQGLHRFPAELPASVGGQPKPDGSPNQDKVKIENPVDFSLWKFKQAEASIGTYPAKIQYTDATGATKDFSYGSQAEAIQELSGLLLSVDADLSVLSQLVYKLIGETVQNKASISLTNDYCKAISDYLGFKYSVRSKGMPLSVDPKKNSIKEFLKESTAEVQTIKLDEPENNDLTVKLNQVIINSAVTKAAVAKKPSQDKLEGDLIKQDLKKGDTDWNNFLKFMNDTVGGEATTPYRNPGDTKVRIKDKSDLLSQADQLDG